METRKPDRRVLKTKRAIRTAFAQLLSRKPLEDITVKDIADTADINRKTFYNYYTNVGQVLDEVENEIVTAFEADLTDFDFQRDVQDSRQVFSRLTGLIESDLDFYGQMFHLGSNTRLLEKLAIVLREKSMDFFCSRNAADPDTIQIAVDYTISGIVSVHKNWFLSGRKIPIEKLSATVTELVSNGLSAFFPPRKEVQ